MELTPQALHDVEFREARRGGYNTRDVDDFLERVAVGIGQLQDRLREAYHRAEAAEGRLADMQRQLDEMQRRGPADSGGGDADETLRRTLVLAQRTADATIKEAKDEANRLLGEARDEVAKARAAAESEAHRDARAELEHLHSTRDLLLSDIDALEQHVDEQRSRLRDGLSELQRLIDEPGVLHTDPAPEVSEVAPAPEAPPPPSSPPPERVVIPAPVLEPAANNGVPSSSNGGYPGSPFAGVEFGKNVGNGGLAAKPSDAPPAFEPPPFDSPRVDSPRDQRHDAPSFDAPNFDPPSFDPPSFDPPSFDPPSFDPPRPEPSRDQRQEAPSASVFDSPSFDPPSFDPPAYETPGFDAPTFGSPPAPSTPAPTPPPAPAPSDGSMVGALQELHNSPPPSREPLPSRELPAREPLPSREQLPSRGESREAPPSREPLPTRNALPPTEPISVPGPGQPGSTGFLPDLNAVFNPPPSPDGPADDLALPIDAPPPPPPTGFEHLQDTGNGAPSMDPGSRPSEWGRGVFDANDEEYTSGEHPKGGARFGPFRG